MSGPSDAVSAEPCEWGRRAGAREAGREKRRAAPGGGPGAGVGPRGDGPRPTAEPGRRPAESLTAVSRSERAARGAGASDSARAQGEIPRRVFTRRGRGRSTGASVEGRRA